MTKSALSRGQHQKHLRNPEQAIQTYFKSLSIKSENLQMLYALSNTNMTFFCSFSLPYAQNTIFLPVVINSTCFQHRRVPVVLLVDYCILPTEENSTFHSYFYLLRMVYKECTHSRNIYASCRHDDTSVKTTTIAQKKLNV